MLLRQGLTTHQSGIKPVLVQQCSVIPAFHGSAVLHDDYQISISHSGQTMGDHNCGTTLAQPAERNLDCRLALGVERACRFVQQQDSGIPQQRPGQCDALPLAA